MMKLVKMLNCNIVLKKLILIKIFTIFCVKLEIDFKYETGLVLFWLSKQIYLFFIGYKVTWFKYDLI